MMTTWYNVQLWVILAPVGLSLVLALSILPIVRRALRLSGELEAEKANAREATAAHLECGRRLDALTDRFIAVERERNVAQANLDAAHAMINRVIRRSRGKNGQFLPADKKEKTT